MVEDEYTAHDVVDWTGYLFHTEVDALQDWARSLPADPVVVNIGAGNGTSGLAFLQARDDLFLWTIEKQRESSPFGCLEGEWAVLEKAGLWPCRRYGYLHGDSAAEGRNWKEGSIDLVFVDADHSYAGCKADIEAWLPHIKPGGLLIVHDYKKDERFAQPITGRAPHPKAWHGVDQAVDELLVGSYEIVGRVDTAIAFRVPDEAATKWEKKRVRRAVGKRVKPEAETDDV